MLNYFLLTMSEVRKSQRIKERSKPVERNASFGVDAPRRCRAEYQRDRRAAMRVRSPDKVAELQRKDTERTRKKRQEKSDEADDIKRRKMTVSPNDRQKHKTECQRKKRALQRIQSPPAAAYNFSDSEPQPFNAGKMNVVCTGCSALHFNGERPVGGGVTTFLECCSHNKVTLPTLTAYPPQLKKLLQFEPAELCSTVSFIQV